MKRWQIGAVLLVVAAIGMALAQHWRAAQVERAAEAARATLPVSGEVVSVTPTEFYRDIKPIFDRRCLVCHGCYDAPCQLKLDAPEGLRRGATTAKVYDGTRLLPVEPTRLFVDAQDTAGWRQRGFFPVLNEGEQNPEANLAGSVLYQMLALKQRHPQPEGELPASFDLSAGRREFCPTAETFAQYAQQRPLQGMPFALPGLAAEEFATVRRWLESGAAAADPPPLSAAAQSGLASWERFLNRDDLKARLMSRYLYEHLFLANLYFDSGEQRQFFKLVRSRTPPGRPLEIIATRLPYDDPAVERVYYRLQPVRATIVAKTHLPYLLSAQRMQRFEELFLRPDYPLAGLPSYAPEVGANPFAAFAALPVRSRYRFLLDDADFFIASFIKGPVCQGQLALNVIDDRFWVAFANPDIQAMVDADFLARESAHLTLPTALANKPLGFASWSKYAAAQTSYVAAKEQFLLQRFGSAQAVTFDLLWQGDGVNQSAALTVFRHFDSASVVKGMVGDVPKTAWVIDYPMLERMYYLLAAGFDIYGDASHQLVTRLYMDFLRMEGEINFLHFLPKKNREAERSSWYQGVGAKLRDSVYRKAPAYQRETGIVFQSQEPKREFFDLFRARLGPALSHRYDLTGGELPEPAFKALQQLAQLRGRAAAYLPEVVLLRVVIRGEADQLFTLIHNDDYSNVAMMLFERERRRPQFDSVTLVPGIVGAYPNAFWVVNENDLPDFVQRLSAANGPVSYAEATRPVAIARSNPKFWQESDWILNVYRNREPIDWGILDYNRYER